MKHESFYKGVAYMLLSATGLSLVGLFAKFGVQDLSVPALIFWRYTISFALVLCFLLFTSRPKEYCRFTHIKMQMLRTFFVLLAQYCFFYYLKNNNLLNASALLNTGPMFISLIEWGVLRKKVGVSSWVGVGVSFIGALLILQPNKEIFSLASLIGLMSGISQGASQVVFGLQSGQNEKPHVGLLHLFALCMTFGAIP